MPMPNDPQRISRLMDLWQANARGLPPGMDKTPFNQFDPMMAYQALGNVPGGQVSPMALRFLQLGQQIQPQPDDTVMHLIQALLGQLGQQRR